MDIGTLLNAYDLLARLASFSGSGLSTAEKKDLAKEMAEACRQWAVALEYMLDTAKGTWSEHGAAYAKKEIEKLQNDEIKLDYALLSDNAALRELESDRRFRDFAELCSEFHDYSLQLKHRAYKHFKRDDSASIEKGVEEWKAALNSRMKSLSQAYVETRTISNR